LNHGSTFIIFWEIIKETVVMKLIRIVKTLGSVLALLMTGPALGAVFNFTPIADASVGHDRYGSTGFIDRDSSVIHTEQNAIDYYGIYEFDISSIPQGADILGASFTLTLANISNGFTSMTWQSYSGDGVVDPSDTDVLGGSFIGRRFIDSNTPSGTELTFSSLPGDNLDTLQSVVDTGENFFGVRALPHRGGSYVDFYSMESGVALSTLTVETADITPVPVPAALPLFASAIGLFGLFGRKRRQG
jgi:hypothetical protein